MYTAQCVCQRHYFRFMRYGTYDLTRKRKDRLENPAGYQALHMAGHPLAAKRYPYVYEHMAVLYDALGPGPMSCALCAKPLTWETCHVDHIDNDVRNNAVSNLRPTCVRCNTGRGVREPLKWGWVRSLTYGGETKTVSDWAKDQRVKVPYTCLMQRMNRGMSAEYVLFAPKLTHNGNLPRYAKMARDMKSLDSKR